MRVDRLLAFRRHHEQARQQHLDALRGLYVFTGIQQPGGAFAVAGLRRRQHLAGTAMEHGVMNLHVEEGFGITELLAALVVDPLAQRTLVVAAYHFHLQLLGAGAADVAFKAHLPLHVGVDGGLEIQAGQFRTRVLPSCSRDGGGCLSRRRLVTGNDTLEPIEHSHVVIPPG
jgi:hypothetical protein